MHFDRFIRAAAPLAAVAFAGMVAACNGHYEFNGDSKGVPLAELDRSGPAPTKVNLSGPDRIVIESGNALTISVEGDETAAEQLRFWLEEGTLGVTRVNGRSSDSYATVRLTMPAPSGIKVSGSGKVRSDALAQTARLSVSGSGAIDVADIDSQELDMAISGSGSVVGAGKVEKLAISISGSGDVEAPQLVANDVSVRISGSGDVEIASDGLVDGRISGSGDMLVRGSAQCSVQASGSGTLRCVPR